ncbi:cellulose biosynthesis cyclic di-GMP-binding regulatory protein BcsB [Alteromonas sp. C1M14]|uniref:cellulose biosynthesis cyclic di-GMP-binding regulatory protein BcsB n=1 Tax=Alteromonas sp. C1M14 TaxID=2841567 RepID=UPI001C08C1F3|nr:cellulose biosynthesis cyclic di-GMP-binding regulatory protein BcsB [Alteromonas sp. C1M14]MBU2979250.1 cellulose biosynthesis cyclic di-GMP-binding regulatory protein BcsB [Alteromonas sp. C1M14]
MKKNWLVFLASLIVSFTAHGQNHVYKLSDFIAGDSMVRLHGAAASMDIAIPLSSVAEVQEARLQLDITSSRALLENRSQMFVRFNNATIGQIAFDPQRPSLTSEITIPKALWRTGFNNLSLSVSQHYANQCEDGGAPELWSEVNLYNSTLTVANTVNDNAFTLNELSGFFNPGIGGQRQVQLYTASELKPLLIDQTLPLIAQALALRNQYQPLKVQHRVFADKPVLPNQEDDTDWDWTEQRNRRYQQTAWYLDEPSDDVVHVLVGTAQALTAVLTDDEIAQIDGAYLKTQRTPAFIMGDRVVVPPSYRLIVSGTTDEQVQEAAQTLAVMDDAINLSDNLKTLSQRALTATHLQRNRVLVPDNHYTFEDFGITNANFRRNGSFNKQVSFRLPADFYVIENASVDLLLDFGYGAGVGPGSVMNVTVNGEFVHGLALDNSNGQVFRNYKLRVPARTFKGGTNVIDFDITLNAPLAGVPCSIVPSSHLAFQLNNSSALVLPDAGSVSVQPDLSLFAETAYPFARFTAASRTTVAVPSHGFFDSALTLIGKLAQVAQTPLLNLHISVGTRVSEEGSTIVLGTPETLTELEQSQFSTAIDATQRWPYRLQNTLHNQIRSLTNDQSFKAMEVDGDTVQKSDLGNQGILLAQQHPLASQADTLFILAAQTPTILQDRVNDLISLSLWGQLAGDFFAWKDNQEPTLAMQVTRKYEVGETEDSWLYLRLWLSNHPWYWLLGFIVSVLGVSVLLYLLLKRRNKEIEKSW